MSPGQTGHITGQMGRVPGTDGTHTRGRPAKILYVYWFFSFPMRWKRGKTRDRKNHDSQRRDRILRIFLCSGIGQFSPHVGAISLLNCTENLEKQDKNPLEKIQKIQWRNFPEIADFCPLSWSNVS